VLGVLLFRTGPELMVFLEQRRAEEEVRGVEQVDESGGDDLPPYVDVRASLDH
jgi:hypothetical protein